MAKKKEKPTEKTRRTTRRDPSKEKNDAPRGGRPPRSTDENSSAVGEIGPFRLLDENSGATGSQGPFRTSEENSGATGSQGPFRTSAENSGPVGGQGPFSISDQNSGAPGSQGPFSMSRDVVSRFVAQPRLVHGRFGLGYVPDIPDRRDTVFRNIIDLEEEAKKLSPDDREELERVIKLVNKKDALPLHYNLFHTGFLTPVENQGVLGSCAAHAVIGLAEYLIKKGTGTVNDLSRMFLYKATRNLMGVQGDTGAYIRTTIKAMAAFGVPPESRWPYAADLLDYEPMAFQYAYAANFKAMRYARLDSYGLETKDVLDHVRCALRAEFPVAFGFPAHASIRTVTYQNPVIPYPGDREDPQIGGHAMLIVGYDDEAELGKENGKGGLIVRNSWGEGWGYHGYAFLPYKYVLDGLAVDLWTIFSSRWLVEGVFD